MEPTYFRTLQKRLVEELNGRIRNGELTERSLARLIGISQPHMHNVLKGARMLVPRLADRILQELGISVLDLLEVAEPGVRRLRAEVVLAAPPATGIRQQLGTRTPRGR